MTDPVLLISDTHYHKFSQYASTTKSGMNSRLADTLRATIEAAKYLRSKGGKNIVHAGDVFHVRGNISPTVLNPVMDVYGKLIQEGFNIYAINGNHDLESNDSDRLASSISALSSVGVQVISEPTALSIDGHFWYFVPWQSSLEKLREDMFRSGRLMENATLVIHAPMNGVIDTMPDHGLSPKEFEGQGFQRVFCGHYHNHRTFTLGNNEYVTSVGALTHQNWGDVGSIAGYCLYLPGSNTIVQQPTQAPRFVKVEIQDLEDAPGHEMVDNYVKVIGGEFTDPTEIEAIKNDVIVAGAKAVVVDGLVKKPAPTRGSASTTAPTLHTILGDYLDRQYPGEGEVKKVSMEILKEVSDD